MQIYVRALASMDLSSPRKVRRLAVASGAAAPPTLAELCCEALARQLSQLPPSALPPKSQRSILRLAIAAETLDDDALAQFDQLRLDLSGSQVSDSGARSRHSGARRSRPSQASVSLAPPLIPLTPPPRSRRPVAAALRRWRR